MLFNLLLARARILSWFFFLFLVNSVTTCQHNLFIITVVVEKTKVKLAPAIPTGAPTTLTEEI